MQLLLKAVLNLIYPATCISCGVRLLDGGAVCPTCIATAKRFDEWQCERCGGPIGPYATGVMACKTCAEHPHLAFDRGATVFQYNDITRAAVLNVKFSRNLAPLNWMGAELADRVAYMPWFNTVDLILPVPLHWTRRFHRRFNQSELLARKIAQTHKKPMDTQSLRRIRRTEQQSILSPELRQENVRDAFRVVRPKRVKGREVLLVDDVMSTGSTASECARALKKAGAKKVYVAVFAR